MEINDSDKLESDQNDLAMLRQKTLQMFKWLKNKPVKFQMHKGASVKANYRAVDYDILNIQVSNLETPIGKMPEALLRVNDITFFEFKL
jgi:gem associated protein 7